MSFILSVSVRNLLKISSLVGVNQPLIMSAGCCCSTHFFKTNDLLAELVIVVIVTLSVF